MTGLEKGGKVTSGQMYWEHPNELPERLEPISNESRADLESKLLSALMIMSEVTK